MNTTLSAKEIAEILGLSKWGTIKRAQKEAWSYTEESGNGGKTKLYPLETLPGDIQAKYVKTQIESGDDMEAGKVVNTLPALKPEAGIAYREARDPVPTFKESLKKGFNMGFGEWDEDPEKIFSESDLRDPRVAKILAILRDVDDMPPDWDKGKRRWIELTAIKHCVSFQSVYRYIRNYENKGIAGICHRKSTKGKSVKWHPDALDFWISLCLKPEHRKMDKKDLYDILMIEAHRRGWQIGVYQSALWWFRKKATPQFLALQRGGMRALDNSLPPILRNYSDLAPFEMLVGDQHRFDFWVVDDDTGEVFRPEGYLWQDLRTRIIYGAAIDKRYDAQLIGLALRIGIGVYGAFRSIYTDNGRPEISRYITGIMANMRSLNMGWERTVDMTMDVLDVEPEDILPIMPGTHKKAIVKNAKAKMIEGTFDKLERLLRSKFRLPGSVKRLSDDIHAQDIDHKEAMSLAAQGKLPLFSEFALTMYRACDYYNREREHRGVIKEWAWKPKEKHAIPHTCLKYCYEKDGWRPRMISSAAANLLFLSKAKRKAGLGRIQFLGDIYEHDALVELPKSQDVDIRYNPMDMRNILVFLRDKYICTAYPVEYSSMKDMPLAKRKIMEKRSRRKKIAEEFRKITSISPDFREYSQAEPLERVAACISADEKKRNEEHRDLYRKLTQEELDREVAALREHKSIPKIKKPQPKRPSFFMDEFSRYEWCVRFEIAGGELSGDDGKWKDEYEANMTPKQLGYWETVKEYGCGGM